MTVIGTNVSALRATSASTMASGALSTAMERLSSGKRINSAKDDAAGLAIASSMTAQIKGMNQGVRNANDGISMAQTAEGALDEVGNMLQRMRELKVQSSNGTYSTADVANIKLEQDALAKQVDNVMTNTKFNGKALFDGTAGASGVVKIQAGANAADSIDVTFGNLKADSAITAVVTGGASVANATLVNYDTAIAKVATSRAALGASQNQLSSAVNNLTSNSTNLASARSGIEDADFSQESTALAKAQILSQASTAMLSQANQSQQGVMSLLR
ncbi:flagellin [Sphingomonas sp. Leaf17]|uniref:flagellin N-terminal helical domain-containing protein n=1 Tax=Sphingomonas sp. Leaf17 TaxID=1735683 RepID=UPI0006FD93CE|nr:flagellin [Sphingomonas sp. Leaf17]KQM67445.1 flagellin [Sphingomonas sp. Leaf17]